VLSGGAQTCSARRSWLPRKEFWVWNSLFLLNDVPVLCIHKLSQAFPPQRGAWRCSRGKQNPQNPFVWCYFSSCVPSSMQAAQPRGVGMQVATLAWPGQPWCCSSSVGGLGCPPLCHRASSSHGGELVLPLMDYFSLQFNII